MYEFMNYLILKLSPYGPFPPIHDPAALKKRASGEWRVKIETLQKADQALVTHQGVVVAQYDIGDTFKLNKENGRVTLNLKNAKDRSLLGKKLDYRTANPVSILNDKNLKFKKEGKNV